MQNIPQYSKKKSIFPSKLCIILFKNICPLCQLNWSLQDPELNNLMNLKNVSKPKPSPTSRNFLEYVCEFMQNPIWNWWQKHFWKKKKIVPGRWDFVPSFFNWSLRAFRKPIEPYRKLISIGSNRNFYMCKWFHMSIQLLLFSLLNGK
jgi:hypothetical protein